MRQTFKVNTLVRNIKPLQLIVLQGFKTSGSCWA